MMGSEMVVFAWGFTACACAAVAISFARSFRRSGDRLFAWFALAFALLAAEQVAVLVLREFSVAGSPFVYIVRLVAFLLIIVAIVEKNR